MENTQKNHCTSKDYAVASSKFGISELTSETGNLRKVLGPKRKQDAQVDTCVHAGAV